MSRTQAAHRMADPVVRRRTAAIFAAIVALAWSSVSLLGRPEGPYSEGELPDLAGLPIMVPQIEQLLPPRSGPAGEGIAP